MSRDGKDALCSASIATVTITFPSGSVSFGGVYVGSILLLHVDGTQYQNWISENKKEVITVLQKSFSSLKTLKIYADTHK